jgi:hypothetical protein
MPSQRSGAESATYTLAELQAMARNIKVSGETYTFSETDARMYIRARLNEAALTARFSGISLDEVVAEMERAHAK